MKRFSFRTIALLITFTFGVGAVLLWFYYERTEIAEVAPVPLLDNGCLQAKSFPGLSKRISEVEKGESGYFPKKTWNSYRLADKAKNIWYGRFLKAMEEKSMLDVSDNTEVYRFLWLRTFHHPIFVRIEKKDNAIQLFSKEFDGAGGYEPGKKIRVVNTKLDENQWCNFLSLLEKSDFWKIPSEQSEDGLDGSQWILEGVKDNRYHVVDRWSPENVEYREACFYLLELSGVDIDSLKDKLY